MTYYAIDMAIYALDTEEEAVALSEKIEDVVLSMPEMEHLGMTVRFRVSKEGEDAS